MRSAEHADSGAGHGTVGEPGPEGLVVDATLDGWRRKATQVVLTVVAGAQLPVVILGTLGYSPTMTPVSKGMGLVVYLVLAVAAACWRCDYRSRLLATFLAFYPALAVVSLAFPQGPYAQAGVITMPIFALVLLGDRAARIAVAASVAIIVSGPFLRAQPAIVSIFAAGSSPLAGPAGMVWFQAAVKAASLFALMVLLERFHRLLMVALAARIAAYRKMEGEVRERRRLEREVAGIGDEERRHLGQELHDGVCQQITAALLRSQGLESRLERGRPVSGPDFATLSSLLAEALDDARNVARGLCPLEPDPDALAPALRALARRTQEMAGVRCELLAAGDVRVPDPATAQHLYRIAQEALSNAARHAHASRITVELRGSDRELTLRIEDDGTGVPLEHPAGGIGMRTMAYRAQILEGELTISPAPGGGTRAFCRVPRAALPAAAVQSGEQRWMPAT